MKLSIFTTLTDPDLRGDNSYDAIKCYSDLGDELVLVDGSYSPFVEVSPDNDFMTVVQSEWHKEFSWEFIGQQFQRGYEACTGDWVIHADLDFIFHEKDFDSIRKVLSENSDQPALSFWKYQFVLPDRYNLKSRLVIAVNKKKYGDRIKFNSGGDLCQPSLDGEYLSPNNVPEARVPFYNYEKLTKTKVQIMDDVGRMERAYKRHFGHTQYGSDGSNLDSYEHWEKAQKGKLEKPQKHISLSEHPEYVQQTIKKLRPDQWGHSMFGYMENDYV